MSHQRRHEKLTCALKEAARWLRLMADKNQKFKKQFDEAADRDVAAAAAIDELEIIIMDLGEKAAALAADDAAKTKQVTDLTAQLAAAQANQLPAGSVAISQAGADAINGAVGDDGSIPPTPVTPPVPPA